MLADTTRVLRRRVLIVDDELGRPGAAAGRSVRALVQALRDRNHDVIEAMSLEDGSNVVISDAAVHCVFVNWTLGENNAHTHEQVAAFLRLVRQRNAGVPVFLMADRTVAGTITIEVARLIDELVWLLED